MKKDSHCCFLFCSVLVELMEFVGRLKGFVSRVGMFVGGMEQDW